MVDPVSIRSTLSACVILLPASLLGCDYPDYNLEVRVVVPAAIQDELLEDFPLAVYVTGDNGIGTLILDELCNPSDEEFVAIHRDFGECDGDRVTYDYFLVTLAEEEAFECGKLREATQVREPPAQELRVGPTSRLRLNVDIDDWQCQPTNVRTEVRLQ